MEDAVGGREGDGDLAAPVADEGAGARDADRGAPGDPFELPLRERDVGREQRDDRSLLVLRRGDSEDGGADLPSVQGQVFHLAEVGEHERAQRERRAAALDDARRRADSPFELVARHSAPRADRALLEVGARRGDGPQHVLPADRKRADVVQEAVVALEDRRVHRPGLPADVGVRGEHRADERLGRRAHAEGVGQQDRRLERAHLLDLDDPARLAETVDHVARRHDFFAEEVPRRRNNGGHTGLYRAVGEGAVSDGDAGDVGDRIPQSFGHTADADAVVLDAL